MLAKYLLLGLINPITTIWILALIMQKLNISMNDHLWYNFPLMMSNLLFLILSCIFTFIIIKNILEIKGIEL